jgi:hypothetical protein
VPTSYRPDEDLIFEEETSSQVDAKKIALFSFVLAEVLYWTYFNATGRLTLRILGLVSLTELVQWLLVST